MFLSTSTLSKSNCLSSFLTGGGDLFSSITDLVMRVSFVGNNGMLNDAYENIYVSGNEFDTFVSNIDKASKRHIFDAVEKYSVGQDYI